MAYLQALFKEAALIVGRPIEELAPIQKLFEENWFDSEQAVSSMTEQDFESLLVPKRLATVLKQLAAGKPNGSTSNSGAEEHQPTYEEVFEEFACRLKHETSVSKRAMLESSRLLELILRNIINNPCEEKYRKLKTDNRKIQDHISHYPCCLELLQFMGFERHGDTYVMLEVEFDHLQFTNQHLQKHIAEVEAMYDPYQSSLEGEPKPEQ